VRGRYGHVSFIADPAPVRVTVVEVVPPRPAKLVDQLTRVLDLAEDLPPVELVPDLVDLAELAGSRPSGHYLFPCRAGGSGAESLGAGGPGAESLGAGGPGAEGPGAGVSYLDEVPRRRPWTLVGCARSRAIHDFFYGDEVDVVDMCPRSLASRRPASRPGPVLTKCCLLEDRVSAEGDCVVVPWGATFAQVKQGLELALRADRLARR
jgi:hypothetical protein